LPPFRAGRNGCDPGGIADRATAGRFIYPRIVQAITDQAFTE